MLVRECATGKDIVRSFAPAHRPILLSLSAKITILGNTGGNACARYTFRRIVPRTRLPLIHGTTLLRYYDLTQLSSSVDRYQPTHHALRHTARTDLTLPRNEKPLCYYCLYPAPSLDKRKTGVHIFHVSTFSPRFSNVGEKKKLRFYLFFTPYTTSMVFLHTSGSIGKTVAYNFSPELHNTVELLHSLLILKNGRIWNFFLL